MMAEQSLTTETITSSGGQEPLPLSRRGFLARFGHGQREEEAVGVTHHQTS
jgi:hypothetical protein